MTTSAASDALATPTPEERQRLSDLITGFRFSQAIYVAARLSIPDLLAEGPRDIDDLAEAAGAHPGALFRLLRFLTGVGLFAEVAPRRFALTPLGGLLRSDIPGSGRPMTVLLMNDPHWRAWGNLLHSVRTGETAFDHTHGMPLFDYLAEHPDDAAVFNAGMSSMAARSGPDIAKIYDFTGIERLVDVGGGHGQLLASILAANPAMQGVLFDRPEVVAGARATFEAAGVAGRCELVSGDFFEAVPEGADAYILQLIIHDWDDARAVAILRNCRRAMAEGGRVLVADARVAPDYREALPVLQADLEMMVETGGRERNDDEYRALFEAAGFTLTRVIPVGGSTFAIYEGVPG